MLQSSHPSGTDRTMWRYAISFVSSSICALALLLVVFGAGAKVSQALLEAVAVVFGVMTLGNEIVIRIIFSGSEQDENFTAALRQNRKTARSMYVFGAVLGILCTAISFGVSRMLTKDSLGFLLVVGLNVIAFAAGAFWLAKRIKNSFLQ